MFEDFGAKKNSSSRWRFAVTTGVSVVVYCLLAGGILFVAQGASRPESEKEIEVRFAPTPAAPPPPPAPAPMAPEKMKLKRVAAPKPAQPLIAPKEIPTERLAEADPSKEVVEVGEGFGEGDGGMDPGQKVASLTPLPPPPPPPPTRKRQPINLPESSVPPQTLGGNASPDYPEEARAKGLEGMVILKVVVTEEGAIENIQVMKGEEPFVSAAVAVVKTWRYKPALVENQPTAVYRIVKIPFRLKA
ncbi:MAG: energy transducer TonB [Myxococcales bacterium]|nr:MAG: energy transducer TonB [Myxococcales bacterium]